LKDCFDGPWHTSFLPPCMVCSFSALHSQETARIPPFNFITERIQTIFFNENSSS